MLPLKRASDADHGNSAAASCTMRLSNPHAPLPTTADDNKK